MNMTTIGLDIVKNVFQVHGADAVGRMIFAHHNPLVRRQLTYLFHSIFMIQIIKNLLFRSK